LIVREFLLNNADDVINAIKNETGQQNKITVEESNQDGINNEKITILNVVYDIGAPIPLVQTSLNGRIAVIVLPDKSYTIEIYGPQTSGEISKKTV